MPTTVLPPTARTHEDQHTSPCSPSPFPPQSPSTSLVLLPSAPSQRCGEKEGCRHTVFPPHRLSLSPQREELTLSSLNPFSCTFFSPPSLSFLLLAVALRASICHCYIQDCLLHESKWVRGTNAGCGGGDERGGLNEIDYRNESEGVLSIHFL